MGKRGRKEVGTDPVSRTPQETSRGCRGTWQGPELRTWHAEGSEERGELSEHFQPPPLVPWAILVAPSKFHHPRGQVPVVSPNASKP